MTNILYVFTVFTAGVLSVLSPCIFPVIPIYLGILSEGGNGIKKVLNTLMFVVGLGFTFILLGFGFGLLGQILYSKTFVILSGIIIIFFGLSQMEVLKIKALQKTKLVNFKLRGNSYIKSFLLGLTFSLGWTPCVGSVLSSILILASNSNSAILAILLMIVYTLGLSLPFIIFSILSDELLKKARGLNNYLTYFKKISGVLIVIIGIFLIYSRI